MGLLPFLMERISMAVPAQLRELTRVRRACPPAAACGGRVLARASQCNAIQKEHVMQRRLHLAYWVVTGVVVAAFVLGGVTDLAHGAKVDALMSHLGYPAYFATILGVWKLLGAIAIVVPGAPRLKEWAYAGMFFDLSGAAVSHAFTGDDARQIGVPLILLALVMGSWALRPVTRTIERGVVPRGFATPPRHTPAWSS
jgi:uncharacterized membrane protein YphA (DoxX/SURF4 family)